MHVSFRSVSLDCLQLANLPLLTLLPYSVTWHHVADVKSSLAITCFSGSLDTACSRKCGSCHENAKIEPNACDFSKAWGFQQKHFKETNMFQTEQLPPTNGKLKYIQIGVLWKHLLTKARSVMPFWNNSCWKHPVSTSCRHPATSALCSPSAPPQGRYSYGFHPLAELRGFLLWRHVHSPAWDVSRRKRLVQRYFQTGGVLFTWTQKPWCLFLLRAQSESNTRLNKSWAEVYNLELWHFQKWFKI